MLVVSTIFAVTLQGPPGSPEQLWNRTAATDEQHGSDGILPDNVEDEDGLEAIDLYTAAGETFEEELGDPEDTEEPATETKHPQTNIADVRLRLAITEIVDSQKTDDFYQTFFATLVGKLKSFSFEGKDFVLHRRHPSIPELKHIVVSEFFRPRVLHMYHHRKLSGHPVRTPVPKSVRRTY